MELQKSRNTQIANLAMEKEKKKEKRKRKVVVK